jgi:hypothetical protein
MNLNLKSSETSPQVYARVGGLLYLFIIVAGICSELFIRGNLIVSNNPTATADNIIASPFLWRIGIVADLLMHVCDIPLMVIFYILLRPVNKNLALVAVLFNLVQSAVMIAYKLNLLQALFLLGNADYLKVFEPQQLQTLAYLAIRADIYGFGIGLIFFGFACLLYGYLILRSGYFPKVLGVLMAIAGLSYLVNNFLLLLAPKFANIIFLLPAFIAELSLCLWLIVKGVNMSKWNLKQTTSS